MSGARSHLSYPPTPMNTNADGHDREINYANRPQNSDAYALKGPREMYELVRRRISTNTKEIWYYVSSELRSLSRIVADVGHVAHVKSTVDEHYRSLLRDVAKLADVDGHSAWRRRENRYLSVLVEKRLHRSQNPPDCGKARKLLCNFVNVSENVHNAFFKKSSSEPI